MPTPKMRTRRRNESFRVAERSSCVLSATLSVHQSRDRFATHDAPLAHNAQFDRLGCVASAHLASLDPICGAQAEPWPSSTDTWKHTVQ